VYWGPVGTTGVYAFVVAVGVIATAIVLRVGRVSYAAEPDYEFDPQRVKEVSKQAMYLWRHYEAVAMHFNDLIMRWRLQAIGGLAALVTAAGFVVGGADDLGVRYRAMFLLGITLLFGWGGVACIDVFYYRRLLAGAVEALIILEDKVPDVKLSTLVERHAKSGSEWAPVAFYLIGAVPLFLIVGWAAYNIIVGGALHEASASGRVIIDVRE
jgi:hypothetical protein